MQWFLFVLFLFPSYLHQPTESSFEWVTGKEHDFGLLEHKRPASFDFQFRNTGDAPIFIENVRTTCGCTKPEYSDAPVQPDSIGTITIGYDAKKIGYFRKRIKVFLSPQRKAEHIIIEGEVE